MDGMNCCLDLQLRKHLLQIMSFMKTITVTGLKKEYGPVLALICMSININCDDNTPPCTCVLMNFYQVDPESVVCNWKKSVEALNKMLWPIATAVVLLTEHVLSVVYRNINIISD